MIVIVMGVVGAGKTTVGKLLAEQLDWEFADADDYHPASNVDKIHRGIPLNDADRAPWLNRLSQEITVWIAAKHNVVLACSALKRGYRAKLTLGPEVKFVYLKGSAALIGKRLRSRREHFAGESILESQLHDLEEPSNALQVDVTRTPPEIVADIRHSLGLG